MPSGSGVKAGGCGAERIEVSKGFKNMLFINFITTGII
jgi:hypothetical protein